MKRNQGKLGANIASLRSFFPVTSSRTSVYPEPRALSSLRIPRSSGHPFHEHPATDSTMIRPPIPRLSGHP
ncbi:MAG: hypothetical protein EOP15_00375 [Pseudomonas sp.]|nr:MAG: hypothetical protein EOP15_00375 [Pseudomonas sp.]